MEAGVSVSFSKNCLDYLTRLSLSEGVEAVNNMYLPKEVYRDLSSEELKTLVYCELTECPANNITVFSIDTKFQKELFNTIIPVLLQSDTTVDKKKDLLRAFSHKLANRIELTSNIRLIEYRSSDLQITPHKSRSTAYNYAEQCFMGLHLDNHQLLPLMQRELGFQVLGINMGKCVRYFHFVNLSAPTIFEMLTRFEKTLKIEPSEISKLTSSFFDMFPDYPVVRLSLKPGEAYIATTQYIIHDGATNKGNELDIALLISGKFK